MKGSYFCTECWRRHIYGRSENNWFWEEHREYALTLPKEWEDTIAEACMQKQKTQEELLTEYLRQGLERDGIEVGSEKD